MTDEELENEYWLAENRKVNLVWQQAMQRPERTFFSDTLDWHKEKADERLAQANQDGIEDSWYEPEE